MHSEHVYEARVMLKRLNELLSTLGVLSAVDGDITPPPPPVHVEEVPVASAPRAKPLAASVTKPVAAPAKQARTHANGNGSAPASRASRAGAKRDPAVITALMEEVRLYIHDHPGHGVEAIGKALSKPTKDLAGPIKKLIAEKKIGFKGERRATKYFPSSARETASA